MPPRPPLLLVDNLLDTVIQYPLATLTASEERTGHEAFRVADYRRERSSWQTATVAAGHTLTVDLGADMVRLPDAFWLDRGHNLWGATIAIKSSSNGIAWTTEATIAVPAVGTLGGDPVHVTDGQAMAVTEEGACWCLFTAGTATARRFWQCYIVTSLRPVVTGVLLGARSQLIRFSTTFDEDARERTQESETSRAAYKAMGTTYAWRTCEIGLATIGAAQYDEQIRALSVLLFDRNQPCLIVMDYGTRPERGWLFQYDGPSMKMPKSRVHRSGRWLFREVGPSVG